MQLRPHHIALSVSALKKSIPFYQQLGFTQRMEWQADDGHLKIVHLSNDNLILELFCYRDSTPAPTSSHRLDSDLPRIGCKHFGLQSENLEHTRLKLEQLGLARGIQIHEGRTGIRYFFIQDPDGIFVEIVEDFRQFKHTTT